MFHYSLEKFESGLVIEFAMFNAAGKDSSTSLPSREPGSSWLILAWSFQIPPRALNTLVGPHLVTLPSPPWMPQDTAALRYDASHT